MIKNLFQLYCMAICFVSALVGLVGGGLVLSDAGDYFFTEIKQFSRLEQYSSNESYALGHSERLHQYRENHKGKATPDDVLSEFREKDRLRTMASIKYGAISSIFTELLWILIAGVFFLIHLRLYKKNRSEEG